MSNEEILQKAIEKAVNNGFKVPSGSMLIQAEDSDFYEMVKKDARMGMVFSHDFARAFFGEEIVTVDTGVAGVVYDIVAWKYYLQQMIISEDPIKYLEKYL